MKTKLYSKFDENTPMLNRVLINRGVPINELRHYMNTTDTDKNDFEYYLEVKTQNRNVESVYRYLFGSA